MAVSPDGVALAERPHEQRDWTLLTLLTFLFTYGFSVYGGVFQNYLRDRYHAGPMQLGMLESIRETPGLLAALTAGTLVALAETRVAGLGLLITGIGVGISGFMPQYRDLVIVTVCWSIGFHLYTTVSSAITLELARGKEGGRHLGRMAGVGAWATLAALASAWVTSHWLGTTLYTPYFVVASISIVLSAGCAAGLSVHPDRPQRARLILRPEYGLFYLLTFLEGCRRQIFSIFASFALILVYHVPLANMLLLQLVNAVLIGISSPAIGKVIDRKGERSPLMLYSVGLIVVFLGYATIRNVYALYSLFLIDNILFSFGVGFTTYLHRIVREGEMTPCLAMGTTMNHIAAVVVPIGGAYLWQRYHNYNLPFWVGVSIAVVALIANQWLPSGPAPANVGEHDILAAETPSEERTAHVSVP